MESGIFFIQEHRDLFPGTLGFVPGNIGFYCRCAAFSYKFGCGVIRRYGLMRV